MKGQGTGEERKALADARGRLFQAAARALRDGTLSDEQVMRVRLALKRARSQRCSTRAVATAAQLCAKLGDELRHNGE
jgi:hypothetical protein